MFLNLTNHPSRLWSTSQLDAAMALGGAVHDLPFPPVPAAAGPEEVDALARATVEALPPEVTHALVTGEYTLTVALVLLLQRRGIACLAASSERDVVQIDAERKEQRFRFVRFRAYPSISATAAEPSGAPGRKAR